MKFLSQLFKKKNENNSVYFKIVELLEDDLLNANFSGNWKKRQEINLKLLWLKTIREVETTDIFKNQDEIEYDSILSHLKENEIKFPTQWKLNDLYHVPFVQEILASYGKTIMKNDYDLYIPESTLDVPKSVIKKAIDYMMDYLNYKNPLYEISDKQKVTDNLNSIRYLLYKYFVDSSDVNLPKNGSENYSIGKELRLAQPYNETEDLWLIDWRNEKNWLSHAFHYVKNKHHSDAIVCYLKAEKLNPKNADTLFRLGLNYELTKNHKKALEYYEMAFKYQSTNEDVVLHLAISKSFNNKNEEVKKLLEKVIELSTDKSKAYYKVGLAYNDIKNYESALSNMKIAANLGNENAKHWITTSLK